MPTIDVTTDARTETIISTTDVTHIEVVVTIGGIEVARYLVPSNAQVYRVELGVENMQRTIFEMARNYGIA